MASNAEKAYEALQERIGKPEGTGDWFTIDQDLINAFADITHDHQFIHVDPERAAQLSPWKVTVAHGFLTLSMLTHLVSSVPQTGPRLEGIVMGMNYGFDKIRFIAPVKVNSRIRVASALKSVELKDANNMQTTRTMTIEIEGEDKPALVADWITRLVFS